MKYLHFLDLPYSLPHKYTLSHTHTLTFKHTCTHTLVCLSLYLKKQDSLQMCFRHFLFSISSPGQERLVPHTLNTITPRVSKCRFLNMLPSADPKVKTLTVPSQQPDGSNAFALILASKLCQPASYHPILHTPTDAPIPIYSHVTDSLVCNSDKYSPTA